MGFGQCTELQCFIFICSQLAIAHTLFIMTLHYILVEVRIYLLIFITYSHHRFPEQIENQKLEFKAQSKVGSMDNVKHKPGGGDIKIFDDKEYAKQMSGQSPLPGSHSHSAQEVRHLLSSVLGLTFVILLSLDLLILLLSFCAWCWLLHGIGFSFAFLFVFVSARICLHILLRGKEILQVTGFVDLTFEFD